MLFLLVIVFFFFVKQKTASELRISDWSSDVCSSVLVGVYGVNDTVDFLTDLDETDSAASIVRTNYRQTRKSRAVFGQVDWPITDKFTVTGGLRYTDDKA